MLTPRCHFIWAMAVILAFIICVEGNSNRKNHSIAKRATNENFEVLLNLYKINPLKQSKLYKQFSNRILLPNKVDTGTHGMHFDSNESAKERLQRTNVNLKQIEAAIHVTRQQNNKLGPPPPSYSVHEIGPEKFNSLITFTDVERLKQYKVKKDGEIFDNILEHIESFETPDDDEKTVGQQRITAKPYEESKNENFATDFTDKNFSDFKSNENFNRIILSTEEVVIMR